MSAAHLVGWPHLGALASFDFCMRMLRAGRTHLASVHGGVCGVGIAYGRLIRAGAWRRGIRGANVWVLFRAECLQTRTIFDWLGEVGGPGMWQMARLVSTLRSGNVHSNKAPTDSPAASLAWEATHLANAVDTLVGGRGAGAGVGAGAVRPTERLWSGKAAPAFSSSEHWPMLFPRREEPQLWQSSLRYEPTLTKTCRPCPPFLTLHRPSEQLWVAEGQRQESEQGFPVPQSCCRKRWRWGLGQM